MSRTLTSVLTLVVVLALALAVFRVVNGGGGEPGPEPARAAVIGPGASTDERVAALAGNEERLADLGDAYLQKARETADASNYPRAQRAFDRALERDPRDLQAIVGLGTLDMARHEFGRGLAQGLRAAALAPEAVAPLPVLIDGYVELGRYREAEAAAQAFVDRKPGLAAYTRASYLRELRGDTDGAVAALGFAVDAGSASPEGAAFSQNLLGTLERNRGRRGAARAAYEAALQAEPENADALAGLAALDAGAGRLDAAVAGMRRVVELSTTPEHRTTLGEYELAGGQERAGRATLDRIPARRRHLAAGGENIDTEAALYEAQHGDPEEGVRLGRLAWKNAPSVRSANALGWALTRAGRPEEGYAWGRRALRRGWRDPLAVYHTGMSAKAAGDARAARRLLGGLLARSPGFSPLYAPRARRALASLR